VKNEVLGDKPVLVPSCQPQFQHGLAEDITWASAVTPRKLHIVLQYYLDATSELYITDNFLFLGGERSTRTLEKNRR
jgi:hypothetical protein